MSFVHLHVHTQYSLLDGMNRSEKLFEKAKEFGMEAMAISDHGVLYGVPEFWKMSKDFGVKPIVGCEMYLSPKSHKLRQEVNGIRYYHLLLLCKNQIGYKNLVKLVSISHAEGMYYKPRIDFETLKKYSEGLICTSACLAGPLSRHIAQDEYEKAEDWLKKLQSVFKDDFYLEIQRNGIRCNDEVDTDLINNLPKDEVEEQLETLKLQVKVNKKLYEYSDRFKIPVIATTDAHYLNKEDKDVQKILFCIRDGKLLDDPTSLKGYVETYIKSPEELAKDFADIPHVLEETLKINEKIEGVSLKFDRVQPKYWNLPKGKTSAEELKQQTFEGAKIKYGEITNELKERLEYELMVIDKMGYNDYFLVVGDLMQYARSKGIVIGVRGSAAGCAVAYALGITNLDPIKWDLVFERFLNLERASPPDIDMDIEDERRDEIIEYAKQKYGERNVAAICTFGKLATKAAIRDVARVMGIDLAVADKLSKMVVVLFGKPYSFDKMMEEDEEFKRIVESDPELLRLGEAVKQIEGLNRHTGVHAAGYLITPSPVDEYMALQPDSKNPNMLVTQMDGTWIDKLDFMKFDFLGLRTLTIIRNTIEYIKKRHNKDIDLTKIPNDDKKAFELFGRGETVGVFQFESPPMQQYLRELQPQNQEDICFLAAAYRPGPMKFIPDYIKCKHGKKEAEYLIPELEPVLNTTFGFPIYQEQLLKICMTFGGFTLGEGDVIRNALKKKQLDILQAKEPDFVSYFVKHYPQYGEEKAKELWGQLKPFSDYGFNKAHSASYAIVAYWCAYLKAHYPLEFVTALMHSDVENTDRVVVDIREATRMGYKVLPPNINKSDIYFAIEDDNAIRFGFAAIKNVGTKLCKRIVEEREKNGEYANLDDLISRVGTSNINKKATECLIKVGALDEFGDRNALFKIIPEVFEKVNKDEKFESIGQTGLFNFSEEHDAVKQIESTPFPNVEPASDREKLEWEKELMGLFISTHPLQKFKWAKLLSRYSKASDVEEMENQKPVKFLGMFTGVKVVKTKSNGDKMAVMSIEDLSGKCDAVVFTKSFEKFDALGLIAEARAFIIEGKVNIRGEYKSVVIDTIEPAKSINPPKTLNLDISGITDENELKELKECFVDGGDVKVKVAYGTKNNIKYLERFVNIDDDECIEVLSRYVV